MQRLRAAAAWLQAVSGTATSLVIALTGMPVQIRTRR